MIKSKVFIYLSILVLLIFVVLSYFYIKNKNTEDKNIKNIPREIPDEERSFIIKELNEDLSQNIINDKERSKIVNELKAQSTKTEELTQEEKINFLNLLNK